MVVKGKTIKSILEFNGIGLHKGKNIKIKLIPTANGGIVFIRTDLPQGQNMIKMEVKNTFDLTRGTNLKNEFGAEIYTTEHFLSALNVLGITDLVVEISGNELPICDGSASNFVELIEKVGTKTLDTNIEEFVIKEPIYVVQNDKSVIGLPYDGFKVTYAIRFEHTFLKSQLTEFEINMDNYKKEISSARTFCFDYEIEFLKAHNLALGGSLENAIVIKKDGVMNPEGLRFEDEFVRHKILDLIGDLKILNRPIKGHIIAIKSGHALDIEFVKKLA